MSFDRKEMGEVALMARRGVVSSSVQLLSHA